LRFSIASLALAPLLAGKRRIPWDWRTAGAGALAGGCLFFGYLMQTLGLRLTSAPKSAFITGLSPVMVPLLAALVYRSRPQISEVAGLVVAAAGLVLMTLAGAAAAVNPGDLLTFLCAIGFAAHIVVLGRFAERMSFEILSVMQVGVAAALSLALFRWAETPHIRWRPATIGAILVTGLLATALAFTIQAWAQRYTTATRTGLIYMLEPVFAWVTSFLLAGEGLSRRAAAGAVLILGGVVLVEVKPLNPRRHPS
jgi:drug/metabolite transporter (DMT)-like permease